MSGFPPWLRRKSFTYLQQVVLALLAECGYGILQLCGFVPKGVRWLLTDDADSLVFGVSINDLVIFISQVFHYFDYPHQLFYLPKCFNSDL
jgi:hypothetical protein